MACRTNTVAKQGIIYTRADDIGKRSRVGGLWSLANSLSLIVLRVAIMALTARLIAPKDFGTLTGGLIIIGLADILWSQGLISGLAQRQVLEYRHVATAMMVSMVISLGIYCLILMERAELANFLKLPDLYKILPFMGLIFPMQALSQVGIVLLQRELRFREVAISESSAYALSQLTITVPLTLLGFGLWALVWGYVANALFILLLIVYCTRNQLTIGFERRALIDILHFGIGRFFGSLAGYAAQTSDNVVVSRYLGASVFGVYTRGYTLMDAVNSVLGTAILRVMMPSFARMQNEHEKMRKAFIQVFSLVTLLVLPISALLKILAKEFVQVILGPRWDATVIVFSILGIGMLFRVHGKINSSLMIGMGKVNQFAFYKFIYLIMVTAGALAGCQMHDALEAVSWFVLLSLALEDAILSLVVARSLKIPPGHLLAIHAYALPITLIISLTAWVFRDFARHNNLPAVVTIAISGGMAMAEFFLCFRFLGSKLWGQQNQQAIAAMLGIMRSRTTKSS